MASGLEEGVAKGKGSYPFVRKAARAAVQSPFAIHPSRVPPRAKRDKSSTLSHAKTDNGRCFIDFPPGLNPGIVDRMPACRTFPKSHERSPIPLTQRRPPPPPLREGIARVVRVVAAVFARRRLPRQRHRRRKHPRHRRRAPAAQPHHLGRCRHPATCLSAADPLPHLRRHLPPAAAQSRSCACSGPSPSRPTARRTPCALPPNASRPERSSAFSPRVN